MNRQVKSLTNSIARADLIFMAIESLILFLVIENIGKLTDIYFVGKFRDSALRVQNLQGLKNGEHQQHQKIKQK